MKNRVVLILVCSLLLIHAGAQIQPGFNVKEYVDLMKVSAQFGDSVYAAKLPVPQGYRMIYNSPVMGIENKWQLWETETRTPIISIRGTTKSEISWLANFYAAMVPAKGELQLSEGSKFSYQLATNPKAAVHVGWLISMSFLAKDMLPKIDSLYKTGQKEFYIMGHSQGGAIAFLLTAYLYQLQKQNLLSPTIRFKTYCSAGPKPGNLYLAYEYEAMTQLGWAFNVVNSADWVPETPISIQTLNDFNTLNPFVNVKGIIKKQSFFKRLALNYAYGRLTKPSKKAAKNYRNYLGKYVMKMLKKQLPGFVEPTYAQTTDYTRAGNTITLLADEEYFKVYPQQGENVFINHLHQPYQWLVNKLLLANEVNGVNK